MSGTGSIKAALTSPTPGSTLTGTTATFTWSPGSGVAEYYLQVGTVAGGCTLFSGSTGTAQSVTVAGLPGGSVPLYVRLCSRFGTTWQFNDYTVTAMSGTGSIKAALTSPTPGSTLTGTTATFTWSPGSGVAEYYLRLGTTAGGYTLFSGSTGTAQSATVAGLPGGSVPLYVRLYSRFGTTWQFNDYTVTAMSGTGSIKAALTSPTPGSTLTGTTATFTWSPGSGVAEYYLRLGTTAGGYTLFSGSTGTAQSVTVAGLPGGSVPLYVRLYSRFGTTWQFNDYTVTAMSGTGSIKAALTSPTPGSTLTGTTATFTWSPGSGVAEYYLQVGTVAGGYTLFSGSTGTAQSVTVAGLPGGSVPLYVRLYSRFGTTWQFNDYTVTASQ